MLFSGLHVVNLTNKHNLKVDLGSTVLWLPLARFHRDANALFVTWPHIWMTQTFTRTVLYSISLIL